MVFLDFFQKGFVPLRLHRYNNAMLIQNQTELNAFCASLTACEFITVDTEFLREKTYYPKLCLIQISGPDGAAKAVDPLDDTLDLTCVYDLLLDEKILKVFHAARQDLEIFYNETDQVIGPIFDTQIAAMVCGYGDSVGYENLVRNITNNQLDKSSQFTDWSRRPLSDKQLHYALGDVTYLIDIYKHLSAKLDEMQRIEWVYAEEEALADPETYRVNYDEMWRKIKIRTPKPKNLAVLRSLAAWREERAQQKNLPRSWIMKDDTLADIAGQLPKTTKELIRIRNMPGDFAKSERGDRMLKRIQKALQSDPNTWPPVKKKKPLSAHVTATLDILKMLLKVTSSEHGVATKLIASSADLEALAQDDDADIPALKGWRREIFGEDALALKAGKLAIGLKGSKICKYEIDSQNGTAR